MTLQRFIEKLEINQETGCWEKKNKRNPHLSYHPVFSGEERQEKASRVIYRRFVGEIPEGLWVLHKCDNPSCVNPEHLFLGTAKDNMQDASAKGRTKNQCGENNSSAKLNLFKVKEIRKMLEQGVTHQRIAEMFGVKQITMSCIKTGRTWRYS